MSASTAPARAGLDPARRGGLGGKLGRNVVMAATILFFGTPIVWLFLVPTKTGGDLTSSAPFAFGSFANVGAAWNNLWSVNDGIVGAWLFNSVFYTVTSVLISLVACVPAGYGLAKFRFRGRTTVLFLTLVTMVVPSAALILPLYLEMSAANLTNTPWAVILPQAFYPFGVYLIYLFASTNIPDSLIEAARLDGASEWGIMWRVFIPLARPSIAMVTFFSFVASWNSFFLPFLMLNDPRLDNLQVGLQSLGRSALGGPNFAGVPIHQPEAALAAIISISPILIVFLFAQRYLVAGQMLGAEKG